MFPPADVEKDSADALRSCLPEGSGEEYWSDLSSFAEAFATHTAHGDGEVVHKIYASLFAGVDAFQAYHEATNRSCARTSFNVQRLCIRRAD